MEEIYKPEYYNATDNIDLTEYFQQYSNEVFPQHTSAETLQKKISSYFDNTFNPEELLELRATCSVDHLKVHGEQEQISLENIKGLKAATLLHHPGEINDKSRRLHTVKNLEERRKRIDQNRLLLREMRDRTLHIKDNTPSGTGNPDLELGKDVVIRIRFFRTFVYKYNENASDDTCRFDHEITVLGSNTLSELRDKIKCSSDLTVLSEVSENPKEKSKIISAKNIYPSGFFFIDGVFYNDFRKENAIDYSEIIRNWAVEKNIGHFETAEMDATKIISLKPRFGYPYIYQHQGRCEHIFIFSHAKLLNDIEPMHKSCYPFHSDVGGRKVTFCFICGLSLPVWIVLECSRLPQGNTPLCNDCFTSYCYLDGKKIGDFKAYPFVNRNGIL